MSYIIEYALRGDLPRHLKYGTIIIKDKESLKYFFNTYGFNANETGSFTVVKRPIN